MKLRRNPWEPPRDLGKKETRAEFAADCRAIQLLVQGTCPDYLQKRALAVIIDLCGTYDLSFRPGVDGARATDFAEGKRWVGLQIVTMLKVNTAALVADSPHAKEHG